MESNTQPEKYDDNELPIPNKGESTQLSSVQSIPLEDPILDNEDIEFSEIDMDNIPEEARTNPVYDHFWKDKEAFDVENFASSYGSKRKWTDLVWTIIFWINFAVTIVLFFLSKPWEANTFSTSHGDISTRDMAIIGGVCIGIAFVICLFTYLFIMIAPRIYIIGSLGIIYIIMWGIVIPVAIFITPWFILVTGIIFVVIFLCSFLLCEKLMFSADVLKSSATVMKRIPSIFFFNLLMFLIQSGLYYLFSCGAVVVYARDISYWIYVYVIISYFWIMQTINYVSYTTVAGATSTWYFLNETEYMPKTPLLYSFAHAIGPSFGPCALAGFLEGTASAFEWIADKGESLPCGIGCCCFSCLKCCCNCCISIIKIVIGAIDRYSLIYCAMFGTPAKEGVKRWKIVAKKKIVDQVVNSCVISTTFKFYAYASMAVGSCVGGFIAREIFEVGSAPFIFLCTIAATCAFNGLELVSVPLEVMSDTLFIGFAEAPLRLETGAKEVYDIFRGRTKELLDKEIRAAKGIEEPKTWWQKLLCCFYK
ncbi:hypothetical protein TRFO_12320 [Tritrichomonas foetus]|uniref:Choline transporter-like protein n=1 Tax=Tritrichomonas foetus TaxID=1144522 RepID=A0A1J4J6G3_9EUKA|nr:hypothetical protein TRFO_12320 [Tritrichomonas foetus]|eukprot:OHS92764.1 hypothetical protein TRFO_12320 [Tritrichomonas foetus]